MAFGQSRALLVWQRIVFPDGSSIQLDNLPATDSAGYAGVADRVDFHTWRLLRGIGLSTLLGVGTQLTFGNDEADLVRALREAAQTNGDRAGQRIVERNLDIQPTIRVRPGFPLLCSSTRTWCSRPGEAAMAELKLARLPERTPVKLVIHVSPDLNRALEDYAALYEETYDAREEVTELVPAMLSAFLDGDRDFAWRRGKS